MNSPQQFRPEAAPAWKRHIERSNPRTIRFMVWLTLKAGRRGSRLVIYGVAAYFFLAGGKSGQASDAYLCRVLGRRPTLAQRFRHVLYFATVVHDRIFFLKARFSLFQIQMQGEDEFRRDHEQGVPLILMGGHLGSFEALRAMGQRLGFDVSMLMYQENAAMLSAALAALNPSPVPRVIPLQRVDAMLIAQGDLNDGRVLGMLADRRLAHEPSDLHDFLGAPAAFPRNPYRLADILKCKIYFMVALYMGGNRYTIHLLPLADFSQESARASNRDTRIAAAQAAYVRMLERFTRMAIFNWFNFFDFWDDAKPKP
jgi:predicted LPLAT superfamily acyltransferase